MGLHQHFDQAFARGAARCGMAAETIGNLLHRRADPGEIRPDPQEILKPAVPAYQCHVLIKHTDALADIVDGRLQKIAIVLDGGRSIIKKFHGAARVRRVAFQHQRNDETG